MAWLVLRTSLAPLGPAGNVLRPPVVCMFRYRRGEPAPSWSRLGITGLKSSCGSCAFRVPTLEAHRETRILMALGAVVYSWAHTVLVWLNGVGPPSEILRTYNTTWTESDTLLFVTFRQESGMWPTKPILPTCK
jgi:hypothetical protein